MKYLLDTNVLSELGKNPVNPLIVEWFAARSPQDLFISSITVGEIAYGIEKMPDGKRKEKIKKWFEKVLLEWFDERVCAVDNKVMLCWARIKANSRTLPVLDSLIAATSLSLGATLVTRNVKDFAGIDNLDTINPFKLES